MIGNALVYRDKAHLTATFARTLSPWIEPGPAAKSASQGCSYSAGSPMMKSVFVESENFTQQCSGAAPATSTSAASIRLAISAFCSSVRPSNQWT